MKAAASITITNISDGLTTFHQYAKNASNTDVPTSGWGTSVPTAEEGKFIWRREGSALTAAKVTTWSNPVCLTGEKGDAGIQGPQGEQGPAGKTGQLAIFAEGTTLHIRSFDEEGHLTEEDGIIYTSEGMYHVHVYSEVLTADGQGYVVFDGTSISYAKLRADVNSKRWTQYNEDMTIPDGQWVIGSFSKQGESIYDEKITAPERMDSFEVTHFMSILKSGDMENINVWANANGIDAVFSKLAVLEAFIDSIVARKLIVADVDDDFVFSVTPDGHITSSGRRRPQFEISVPDPLPNYPANRKKLLHINAEGKKLEIDTDGAFSGIIDSPALTTAKGSVATNKTFTPSEASAYPVATLYDSVSLVTDGSIQTITDSYYKKPIVKAGRLSASGAMLTLGSWSVDRGKQGSGWVNYTNTTVPAGCNYINVTLTIYNDWGIGTPGGANIEIWRGSTRIVNQTYRGSFSSTKSASYAYDVQPGDIIKAFVEGYSISGTSHGYVDVTYRAKATQKSLFFIYTDGSSEFVPYSYYTNIDAKAGGYSTTKNLFVAGALRSLLVADFATDVWIPCLSGSQYSIKALGTSLTTKSIVSVKIISNSVQFMDSTGVVFTVAVWGGVGSSTTGLYETLSATLVTEATPRRIDVSTLTPKAGASVGTEGEPFNFGHFKILAAQTDVTVKGKSVLATEVANGYPGMLPGGGNSNYIRTGQNGLIPYQSGGSGYIGTSGWPFQHGYFNNLYIAGKQITKTTHKYQPAVNGTVYVEPMDVGEMRVCTFGPLGTSSGNDIEAVVLPSGGTYRVEGLYSNYNGLQRVGIAATPEDYSYASGTSFVLFPGNTTIATDNGSSRTDVYNAYFIIWRMS